jgi:hypothetical protein
MAQAWALLQRVAAQAVALVCTPLPLAPQAMLTAKVARQGPMALAWAWLVAVPTVVLVCTPPPLRPQHPQHVRTALLAPTSLVLACLQREAAQAVVLARIPLLLVPQAMLPAKVVVPAPIPTTWLPRQRQAVLQYTPL